MILMCLLINLMLACVFARVGMDRKIGGLAAFILVLLFGIFGMLAVIASPIKKENETNHN